MLIILLSFMNCYSIFASYFPTDFWKSCLALSPGALLWISSDEDDPRIFLVGKFGNFFFFFLRGGGDFFGYSKQSEDLLPLCCRVVLQIKFNQLQTWARKFVVGFLGGLIFGPGIFWVLIFAPIQSSHLLKSGVPSLGLYESNKANGALCAWDERGEK